MTNQETTIATAPLGHDFTPEQLKRDCRVIIGAVAWPGKQPGFGLVLAVTGDKTHQPYEIHLLDEAESGLEELIRRCDAMDAKYLPERWIGKTKKAADEIMWELWRSRQPANGSDEVRRAFNGVCSNAWVEDDGVYESAMPKLKSLLRQDERRLFLKASRIPEYLGRVNEEDFPFLKQGEYPAIEALAFAVREALDWIEIDKQPKYKPNQEYERTRRNPMSF